MSAVTLADVKQHLNITSSTNDTELPTFIDTAQQIVEQLTGPVEPVSVTEVLYSAGALTLSSAPAISITSVTEYGATVSGALYVLDVRNSAVVRLDGRGWYGSTAFPLTVVYQAGRSTLPAALKWAIMEEAAHLWRATQSQRGGRSRGESDAAPTGYALPNRVREAIAPYVLIPAVG